MNYPLLYHYTTINGLLGIISKCQLWCSDCRFLNDGMELQYAKNFFFKEIEKLELPPLEDGAGYSIAGESLDNFRMFISCFCEKGDLLSQWRGYGLEQCYALGFDFNLLEESEDVEICPVQYGIDNPQEYFADELHDASYITAHPGNVEWHRSESLLPRLARVKDPNFKEECEWRIMIQIAKFDFQHQSNGNFRPSLLGPIPYVVFPFPKECLREIIIGPGAYSSICEQAVHSLLEYNGLDEVKVISSKIPFRR